MNKIIRDKAEGIFVVPKWPMQPWYPLFISMLIKKPVILRPKINSLTSPFRKCHLMAKTLTLVANRLSEGLSKERNTCRSSTYLIQSLIDSTLKQYNSAFQAWWVYCELNNIELFEAGASEAIKLYSFYKIS